MVDWIKVEDRKPKCSAIPGSLGVPVLIWPRHDADGCAPSPFAFYGRRQTDGPNFYLYGSVIYPTHWAPLPKGPAS